ncbi:MAG: NAD(P)/FAD-dependent oxidoreductase [Phycisphaerae bacterium]
MHYDVVIIGAGMSGLAAGIRLAYFEKRVCIVEQHYAFGGLNSYYTLDGRKFDVGLHAVTNCVPPDVCSAPLPKLLRQLRLRREDFDLRPQRFSEVRFPNRRLRFTNDIQVLVQEVAERFPRDADNFRRLLATINEYDDTRLAVPYRSTRQVLRESLREPALVEMLLCPIMYYGSAEEHDMDFTQFVTIFKSIFCEGLARPRGGVRTIIKTLVKKFCECSGKLKMSCGVRSINVSGNRATGVTLDSGETLTADVVLSSAGYFETMCLCSDATGDPPDDEAGRISFVESIAVVDTPPAQLGHEATIVFFNDAETVTYAVPDELVDLRSGVLCCPGNYEGHDDERESFVRVTWLASYDRWAGLDEEAYHAAKQSLREKLIERVDGYIPGFRERIVYTDVFTPRTIRRYTGHINGAVYGTPRKRRDGRTRLENLFICGTDQGYLGIIGAMLSGITIANLHILSKT